MSARQIEATVDLPSIVTTKAHGVGIGLTIVRSIVDAHDGTIVARNNPEGGATFTVHVAPRAARI
jgi:signal transduction histidine kinase